MVAVDGASSAPTTRLRRLLRRSLLVAALAAAGWLLSALFASTASAETPAPPADLTDQHTDDPADGPPELPARPDAPTRSDKPASVAEDRAERPAEPGTADDEESAGAPAIGESAHQGLGAVLGGVTNALTSVVTHVVTQTVHQVDATVANTVATLTSTVLDTAEQVLAQDQVAAAQPQENPTGIAPTATTPTPVPAPRQPPAIPATLSTAALAQDHTSRAPVATQHRTNTAPQHDAGRHVSRPGPAHPLDVPAPVAPGGTSVSNAHDSAGGARTTHGVLSASATLPPAPAGYTTRSRAADATGRVSGLPATSPD
jgi:hypothetical protein